MAGSFGFEADHYDISLKVAERVLLPAVRLAERETMIITDGFSCRQQIEQTTGRRALHPAQVLQLALHQAKAGPENFRRMRQSAWPSSRSQVLRCRPVWPLPLESQPARPCSGCGERGKQHEIHGAPGPFAARGTRGPAIHRFMFATGIECSYPVITSKSSKDRRYDEMELIGHYERWKEDFQLVLDLGIRYLRYGPPYYKVHVGPNKYDWSFVDETFHELRRLGIVPIADLCHFGVPDWIGDFQSPDWPELFADFAEAFAQRYPWVRFFTPVNEIFVCATFSAQFGWWNERLESDKAFATALKHLVRANILAEEAILRAQPAALFIQSEATQYFHCEEPEAHEQAEFYNNKRFLSLDLCYGIDLLAQMYQYMTENGVSAEEYRWFMEHGSELKPYCIMGNDYYVSNEHAVSADGSIVGSGEIFGYYVITKQYYDRYHWPVMHTETNLRDAERAPEWLRKEWMNMFRLREDGVPIIGFTWYSLLDQVDWDVALRVDNGTVNPLGLYDWDRKIRLVGKAYKKLITRWRDILQADSLCFSLNMPMVT
jgi:beta-glucosidase/6-phospho-beta-glucosidase/beta-galactosidase